MFGTIGAGACGSFLPVGGGGNGGSQGIQFVGGAAYVMLGFWGVFLTKTPFTICFFVAFKKEFYEVSFWVDELYCFLI